MPTFEFEAMNSEGKAVRDQVQARNTDEAIAKIREQNLFPTRVRERAQKAGAPGEGRGKKVGFIIGGVSNKRLTEFTRQLSTLTDAGIPVVQSLNILEQQMRPCALKRIVGAVSGEVESGSSLSEGMGKYPKAFDNLYVNMIKAGEAGGVLDVVLQRLAEFREKAARLKRRIVGAMIYPAVVITFAIAILTIVIVYVIPKFMGLFTDLDVELPLPTRILLRSSELGVRYWYLIPTAPIALFVFYKLIRATRMGRRVFDWLKIHVPVFGKILSKGAIARFTRTFGTLISSGVPILEALTISRDTAGNVLLADAISNVHDGIREGEPIADPLRESGVCDEMVVNMINVGEETGDLDKMLMKVADNYDDQVDTAVEGLTAALEPVMVVMLGSVIGFVVVSLFLPLITLMESLS